MFPNDVPHFDHSWAALRFMGIKIGETPYLCCNYNARHMRRARELRYQEAFWTFRWWVRVLILLNVFYLTLECSPAHIFRNENEYENE